MSFPIQRRDIVVAGLRLRYFEREPTLCAAKQPILLLHGLMASAETFTDLVSYLPTDRRIVALDLLAAEPSGPEDSFDLSFAGLAKLIESFTTAIQFDQPVVLGHSHGGALALQLAATYPERLNALILLCPAHPFGGYNETTLQFYLSWPGYLFGKLIPRLPRVLQFFGVQRMAGRHNRLTVTQLERYRRALLVPQTVARALRLVVTWHNDMGQLREAMQARPIATPTLLLWGDRDPVVPLCSAVGLTAHITCWERFTLSNAGHLINDEKPKQCAEFIEDWLQLRDNPPRRQPLTPAM